MNSLTYLDDKTPREIKNIKVCLSYWQEQKSKTTTREKQLIDWVIAKITIEQKYRKERNDKILR